MTSLPMTSLPVTTLDVLNNDEVKQEKKLLERGGHGSAEKCNILLLLCISSEEIHPPKTRVFFFCFCFYTYSLPALPLPPHPTRALLPWPHANLPLSLKDLSCPCQTSLRLLLYPRFHPTQENSLRGAKHLPPYAIQASRMHNVDLHTLYPSPLQATLRI